MIKRVFLSFVGWKILVYAFALVGVLIFPMVKLIGDYEFQHGYPYLVWVWGKFDGLHYMTIAKYGYSQYEYPFFPLYPLLINASHIFLKTTFFTLYRTVVGQLISNVAFFLGLFVMVKLLIIDKNIRKLHLFLLVIFLFPTSFFYGAVYNDALFFLLGSLTIYFARKESFFQAGIFGFFATLTRLNGLALCFILLFEYIASLKLAKDTWNIKVYIKQWKKIISIGNIFDKKIYAIFLIPGAFFSYLTYIHITFGSWTLVFSSMKLWQQDKITFPLQVFWRYMKILFSSPRITHVYFVAAVELLFVLFYIFLMIYTYKKIRLSYWLFFVISILIPSLTGTFQGMPRYALHIYPFFLSLTLFLHERNSVIKIIYFVIALTLLFFGVALFTRGYFVA